MTVVAVLVIAVVVIALLLVAVPVVAVLGVTVLVVAGLVIACKDDQCRWSGFCSSVKQSQMKHELGSQRYRSLQIVHSGPTQMYVLLMCCAEAGPAW
jgi:hypothetical protein